MKNTYIKAKNRGVEKSNSSMKGRGVVMHQNDNPSNLLPIPYEVIEKKILFLRGEKVMIDRDLAELYGVETKQLKRAVRRNILRFPSDFMFELTREESRSLWCHFGALKRGKHSKYLDYVFTEQGVAMLSSIINSKRAILVNIQIIRTFTKLRKMLMHYKELKEKIENIENKYDHQFKIVFDTIRQLMKEEERPPMESGQAKKKFGFIQ